MASKKKVLFVATVVRCHINLFHTPYLKWFQENGWETYVASRNDFDHPEECRVPYCDRYFDLPFERYPLKWENAKAYRQLKQLIDRENFDLIYCHTPVGAMLARLAAGKARKKGTKVIYMAHGFHFYEGAPLINWLAFYPVEWLLSFRTDMLITMNKEDFKRAGRLHAKRVEYIPGVGLDLHKFTAIAEDEKKAVRRELHLDGNDVFAISVAQLIPRKNHITLIQAVSEMKRPDFHLFICGDGVQLPQLQEAAERLGVKNQIHFLGFRRDIYKLCSAADIFLFASLQEGLPVAVMEAMACGLPIVCSDIRGNRDLIVADKGGYLCDPRDVSAFVKAISKMLEDREALLKMKQFNLERIQLYRQEKIVGQMAALYQDMAPDHIGAGETV